MKYTLSNKGNKKITKDMEIICKEILKRIKGVNSIMLTGGFSRGEGPIKIERGKIFPYNDYDIQVISNMKYGKEETDKIATEISKLLGYKGIINFYPFRKEEQNMQDNFYIDLKIDLPEDLKKMLPRIRTVELKKNSKILYGKDMRYLIPEYNLKDIPSSEGAKLLLDRMSQMIEYFSINGKHDKEFLTYIIQQAYAACCTALLLLSRKYEIGYKRSMNIFKENYKKDFPELYEKIPDLAKRIEKFIKWKINPEKKEIQNVEKEWFIAKKEIMEVSKYFFSKFLRKKIETIEELSKEIMNMKKEFYIPYLKNALKKKVGISLGGNFFLPLVSLVLKKKYLQRLKKMGIKYNPHKYPDLIIFSSLIYLISSIDNGKIDKQLFEEGKKILNKAYPVKGNNWEDVSIDYANAYIAFFLQKI